MITFALAYCDCRLGCRLHCGHHFVFICTKFANKSNSKIARTSACFELDTLGEAAEKSEHFPRQRQYSVNKHHRSCDRFLLAGWQAGSLVNLIVSHMPDEAQQRRNTRFCDTSIQLHKSLWKPFANCDGHNVIKSWTTSQNYVIFDGKAKQNH